MRDEKSTFTFGFAPTCFKAGNSASDRPAPRGDFPCLGRLIAAHEDALSLAQEGSPAALCRATKEPSAGPIVLMP